MDTQNLVSIIAHNYWHCPTKSWRVCLLADPHLRDSSSDIPIPPTRERERRENLSCRMKLHLLPTYSPNVHKLTTHCIYLNLSRFEARDSIRLTRTAVSTTLCSLTRRSWDRSRGRRRIAYIPIFWRCISCRKHLRVREELTIIAVSYPRTIRSLTLPVTVCIWGE